MTTTINFKAEDCAAEYDKAGSTLLADTLNELSAKRKEIQALEDEEWLAITRELIHTFHSRHRDWESVNQWIFDDARVHKLCSAKKKDELVKDPFKTPTNIHYHMSLTRFCTGGSMNNICSGWESAFKYKISLREQREKNLEEPTYVPDCIKNATTMQTIKGKYKQLGRVVVPSIPNHQYNAWCREDELEAYDDELNGREIPLDVAGPDGNPNSPGFSVVLVAGNQMFLGLLDTINTIFTRKEPILIKHHPLRPYLLAVYEIIFEPLIRRGYVKQMLDHGNAYTSKHVLGNPLTKHIHITGSLATVEKLEVELAKTRPTKSKAEIHEMITSELGCASPCIITPGVYTEKELKNIVTTFLTTRKTNGGSNCLSSQSLVLPKEWKQKAQFRKLFDEAVATMPQDPAYYPGVIEKGKKLLSSHEKQGQATVVQSRFSFALDDDPDLRLEFAQQGITDTIVVVECGTPGEEGFNKDLLASEAFSALIAIVEFPGGGEDQDPTDYLLNTAVPLLNDKNIFFGSLVCNLMHPKTVELSNDVLAALRYSSVCINTSTAFGYGVSAKGGRWGGHAMEYSHQSGRSYIGNCYGLKRMDKCVVQYTAGLEAAPVTDSNNMPPPIVLDAVHISMMTDSFASATISLLCLFFVRFLQLILPQPVIAILFGDKLTGPYMSPMTP